VDAERLQVRDEVPRRVLFERSMRGGFAAAALVEEDDPIRVRVKEATVVRLCPEARPAVQEHDRLATSTATLLVVELVDGRDAEAPRGVRLDR
jgi:hypothetical protein